MAKSFIKANLSYVSGNFKPEYITKKGDNHGAVMFLGKGVKIRERHETANEALASFAADKDLPKGVKTLVNGNYMSLAAASKLDVEGYQFEGEDDLGNKKEVSWGIQFMTADVVAAKNKAWADGTKAPKDEPAGPTGPLPKW